MPICRHIEFGEFGRTICIGYSLFRQHDVCAHELRQTPRPRLSHIFACFVHVRAVGSLLSNFKDLRMSCTRCSLARRCGSPAVAAAVSLATKNLPPILLGPRTPGGSGEGRDLDLVWVFESQGPQPPTPDLDTDPPSPRSGALLGSGFVGSYLQWMAWGLPHSCKIPGGAPSTVPDEQISGKSVGPPCV